MERGRFAVEGCERFAQELAIRPEGLLRQVQQLRSDRVLARGVVEVVIEVDGARSVLARRVAVLVRRAAVRAIPRAVEITQIEPLTKALGEVLHAPLRRLARLGVERAFVRQTALLPDDVVALVALMPLVGVNAAFEAALLDDAADVTVLRALKRDRGQYRRAANAWRVSNDARISKAGAHLVAIGGLA